MREYFTKHMASDPYRPKLGSFNAPDNAPDVTHVAYFSDDVVIDAPHALE